METNNEMETIFDSLSDEISAENISCKEISNISALDIYCNESLSSQDGYNISSGIYNDIYYFYSVRL